MCNKVILVNGGTLESVPDQHKTSEMVKKMLIIMLMC